MKDEIYSLKSLYEDVQDVQLDTFLTEEDLATIEFESDQMRNKSNRKYGESPILRNLQNRLIVPRNHFRRCTVVVQRLHTGFIFKDWLKEVARKVLFNENTQIRVGFSFLCWKPITNDRTYLFSAKPLAPFQFTVDSEDELLIEFSKIGSLTDSELLNKTFVQSIPDNPFAKSGFCPLKIVCSYIYITK